VLAGPAAAADLPIVAKAPPAIAASWAGFYLGVHGGYGWKQDDFSLSDNFTFTAPQHLNGVKSQGAVYGGHVGYNWQFGRAVTGLELDFSASDIKGSNGISETNPLFGGGTRTVTLSQAENVKYLGSARARLGWLPTDNVLLYGTAGLAWERLDSTSSNLLTDSPPAAPATQLSTTKTPIDKFGWVAGVGAEMMLGSPNWIGRVEYLHYDFGQVATASSFDRVGGFRSDRSTAGSQTIDLVRAGVSYKFGEPSRVASMAYYGKAPAAAPQATWAGFYLGVHGGYGWGDDPFMVPGDFFMFPTGTALNGVKSKGWAAGGHMGHNWQYGRVVTGLEIDLSAADIKGTSNTLFQDFGGGTSVTVSMNEKVQYLGTARGRLGWAPVENLLLYGTAGLAWERLETGAMFSQTSVLGTTTGWSTVPADRFGWVAGVGGEMMLGNSNWIGRIEYLHYDFGRISDENTFSLSGAPPVSIASTSGRQTIDLLRAGVSYKFGPDVAVASGAQAMYAKAPRVSPPSASWAGFYLGAHAGYGWKENDFATSFFDTFVGGIKSKGWLAGGQAGYNWQYASVVAGLEIDGSATGIKGSSATATDGVFNETLSDNVKYLGTARARLGWTPAASWLLYGTGGLAWERVHRSRFDFSAFPGTPEVVTNEAPRDHFGWAAGVGVETFIGNSNNWIARLEYLHYDFGTVESTFNAITTVVGDPSTIEKGGRQTIDTVRAGVSYKFTP
jgi:outer membrane immunogenic protein